MVTFKKWSLLQTGKLCSKFGAFALTAALLLACGDDDGDIDANDGSPNVRIVEVNATNGEVTLKNFGDADADISGYFFCSERTYVAFSETTNNGSDFTLTPDEEIRFTISVNSEASDVAIYNTNGSFASASALVDFMQYGGSFSGTSGREDVAVEKGIWTAGDFVEGGSPFTYDGDGTSNGVTNWSGEELGIGDGESNVRILSVDPANDKVVLKNFGNASQDISDYFFCRRKAYANVAGIPLTSGDLILDPDEEAEFTLTIDDNSSDVALYLNNSGFANPDNMLDFLQFGDDVDAAGREDVAVAAGIWIENEYINGVGPYTYDGDGDTNGLSQWSVEAAGSAKVRLLSVDAGGDKVVLKNFGNASQNVSSYFFCRRKSYSGLSGLTVTSGNLILAPNEELEFTLTIDDTSSDVALYLNNSGFANPDNILDFMQFGADVDAAGREDVAVGAGIWTENDFVTNPDPFEYTGDGDQNGASFWN